MQGGALILSQVGLLVGEFYGWHGGYNESIHGGNSQFVTGGAAHCRKATK